MVRIWSPQVDLHTSAAVAVAAVASTDAIKHAQIAHTHTHTHIHTDRQTEREAAWHLINGRGDVTTIFSTAKYMQSTQAVHSATDEAWRRTITSIGPGPLIFS